MPSWDSILQFATACLLVWVGYRTHKVGKAVQEVHLALNSRLDLLLQTTKELATKMGMDAGREQVLVEQASISKDNE